MEAVAMAVGTHLGTHADFAQTLKAYFGAKVRHGSFPVVGEMEHDASGCGNASGLLIAQASMLSQQQAVQVTDSHLKMAELPEGCTELIAQLDASGQPQPFPLLKVDHVYVLPGVPALVQKKWHALKEQLQRRNGASAPLYHNQCDLQDLCATRSMHVWCRPGHASNLPVLVDNIAGFLDCMTCIAGSLG